MLNKKVAGYIKEKELLDVESGVLVALSGGADSVALLCVLLDLGYKVEAAHCNFHLRGAESDRDEEFCRTLCREKGVELHLAHFDTSAYAKLHGMSIEMAARELRYSYFEQLRRDLGLGAICVAHHKDDSVETFLLNLMRGTGIEGLKGIAPKNGYVIRPLLCVDREEILSYLGSFGQGYVVDSTNLEDDVQRNKVRLNLVPLMKTINPAACRNIAKAAERVASLLPVVDEAMAEAAERVCEKSEASVCISLEKLKKEISPEPLLWNILKDKGFSSAQVESIYSSLDAQTGREWTSSTYSLVIDRGSIIVEPLSSETPKSMRIPETGTYVYDENHKFSFSIKSVDADFVVSKNADCVCLDADAVAFPLMIRPCQPGDNFVPFGMKGRKLLSDFLTDRKMSLFEKRRQLVIADANGNVVWVVGLRPDNRCRITGNTQKSLVVSFA